jgi:hypothetical protein
VPALQAILTDNMVEIITKTFAIIAIGDLILATEANFMPYFAQCMSILDGAASIALESISQLEAEDQQVRIRLRKAILDCYNSMMHGCEGFFGKAFQMKSNFVPYADKVFFYLYQFMLFRDMQIDFECCQLLVDLYIGLAMQFNDELRQTVERNQIQG